SASGDEFGAGSLCQRERSATVGKVERGPEDLATIRPLPSAAEAGAEVCHGARVLQPRGGALEHAHRLAQQLDPAASALREAGRAQRYPERAWGVVGLGERDLLGGERPCFGLCPERELREGSV